MVERRRRLVAVVGIALVTLSSALLGISNQSSIDVTPSKPQQIISDTGTTSSPAAAALERLEIKGRASKTGYSRAQFSSGWQDVGNCDMRNFILARDMTQVVFESATNCTVVSGTLADPYTGMSIAFRRGPASSTKVQIDHVVALSDAWQKGAQLLPGEVRYRFANDPLNLLAVDGQANNAKSDSDAATWLPPNKPYRCRYVARQVAVKQKYRLWVTRAEHNAIGGVLAMCPGQVLPMVSDPAQ